MNQSKKSFLRLSHKISSELNFFLSEYLNKYQEIKEAADSYLKKNIHLNGLQFYAGFSAYSEKTAKEYIKFANIPIIIELVMLWAYKTNKIVDRKQDVWDTEQKIKDTILEHDLIYSLIIKLLEDSKEQLKDKHNVVSELILRMMSSMADGFWWEHKELCIKNKPFKEILHNWDKKYLKRNIYFDLVYDFVPLIGYYIASGDDNVFLQFEKKIPKSKRLSHVGQVVNDLSDWCEINDLNVKSYQDSFADIRNGYVTYPVYMLKNYLFIEKAFKQPDLTFNSSWKKDALKALKEKKLVDNVMIMGKDCYNLHALFWEQLLKRKYPLIEMVYGVVKDNKYFNNFNVIFKNV